MKIIDRAGTRQALPFNTLIEAIARMFVTGCQVPTRHVHTVGNGKGAEGTVLIMPAWHGDYMGIKTVNIFPGNAARGRPGLHSTYILYSAATGEPLAQMDGDEITSRRTAAASALAARHLARRDARRLVVAGSGRVASLIPEAYRTVLPIEDITIWSRNPEAARRLAGQSSLEGCAVRSSPDLEQAVRTADLVSCATLATTPIIRGEWLAPGSHLDLIGGFTPAMREADDACFSGSRLYVDTVEALQKSGDLLGPMSRGVFAAEDVAGTLESLCRSQPGRPEGAHVRTVFKSVGTALEDLAAAILVYEG
ncbi:ornithine cyclodeaminase family protein [Massilia sp. LXY-6]|uniref:ornithine cyclodeaminase family protein n=1 Tax=Massilia sp. LXY-6 TaxID=3379823 RepID=UPI003EDEB617